MAASAPGEQDPRVRKALGALRVASAAVCLVLVAWLVLDRRNGGFEYMVALLSFVAGVLGLPHIAGLIRKE